MAMTDRGTARGTLRAWSRYGPSEVEEMATRARWSPTVMRRLLAQRLSAARQRAGYKPAEAAKSLGIAPKTLQYTEDASRRIAQLGTLDAAIKLYEPDAEEEALWQRLWELSQQRGWWDNHEARPDDANKSMLGTEWGAAQIASYSPMAIPTYLQTPAYARATVRQHSPHEADRVVEAWVDVAQRRGELVTGSTAAKAHLIVEESALTREVGGPEVLAGQLDALVSAVTGNQDLTFRVLPFSAGYIQQMRTSFAAVWFEGSGPADLFHVDITPTEKSPFKTGIRTVENDQQLADYERAFNQLNGLALDEDATLELVERARADLPVG